MTNTTPRAMALETIRTALAQCADLSAAWETDDSPEAMHAISLLAQRLRAAGATKIRQPSRWAGNTLCEATAMEPRNTSLGHGIRRF